MDPRQAQHLQMQLQQEMIRAAAERAQASYADKHPVGTEAAGSAGLGQGMVSWLQRWLPRPARAAQEASTSAGGSYGAHHAEWL